MESTNDCKSTSASESSGDDKVGEVDALSAHWDGFWSASGTSPVGNWVAGCGRALVVPVDRHKRAQEGRHHGGHLELRAGVETSKGQPVSVQTFNRQAIPRY